MTYAELLARYLKKHKKLVEPVQGFDSLHSSLHLAYSMGRVRGFTDLGTYVDKPGDHGWDDKRRMALAFDLGRKDRFLFKGWGYLAARRLALLYWKHHKALNINYVILGDRIISRRRPYWHYYGPDRSHFFHIHVSGVEPSS
mgnify:CR=1 FL=1